MKFFKELPVSIYHSIRLSALPLSKLLSPKNEEVPVVVSLTSIPSRLSTLHLVIRSLLTQSYRPKKIVLWLNGDMSSSLPRRLTQLKSDIFEIRFSDLHSSHKKLIHTLELYPDEVIATCDDDMMYRKNWLELLYLEHKHNPGYIIGNRTKHITYDKNRTVKHYREWKYPENNNINTKAIVAVGAWGILYPPGSMDERVNDIELFEKLSPYSDDLWFKALGLLKGTKTRQAEKIPMEPIPLIGSQKIALKTINIKNDKNFSQWKALSEYFDLDTILLSEDTF